MTWLRYLFGAGYRVFFLTAGLFSIVAVLFWEVYLGFQYLGAAGPPLPFVAAPSHWHGHELVFGYGSAVLTGFLLTAVPNWTGTRPPAPWVIALLFVVWALGRLSVSGSVWLPPGLVAILDLSFLPVLAFCLVVMLRQRPKPQNLMFILFLAMLWIGNLLIHLDWLSADTGDADKGLRVGLFMFIAMIAVMGGRITPAFTRNALKRAGKPETVLPVTHAWRDRAGIALALSVPLAILFGAPRALLAGLALMAGLLQLARMTDWSTRHVLDQPILWILHITLGVLAGGLALWGLSQITTLSEIAALHVLGIGAIGAMTCAVMSRAILGHSGKELRAPRAIVAAYWLIFAAAILRGLGAELAGATYLPLVLGSGMLWIAAFALFVGTHLPDVLPPKPPAQ